MSSTRLEQIKSMLEEKPNDAFLMFALARELEGLEHWTEAVDAYEKLKEVSPDYVGLYYHLAALYAELGEHEKASATYAMGIQTAEKLKDHHALGELKNAFANFEMGL
jgi:tetratricopeptide (TPR) repeat protein